MYVPVSPLVENIRANRIAFRDLARDALAQLRETGVDKRKIVDFEERFDHLAGLERDVQDEDKIRRLERAKPDRFDTFWHYQAHGLAMLSTPGLMRMFRLPNSPKPLAEVADRLHLTPLIRAHDVAARYLRAGIGGRKRPADPRLRQFFRHYGCRFQACLGKPSERYGVRPFTYGLRAAGCKTWKAGRYCCINM